MNELKVCNHEEFGAIRTTMINEETSDEAYERYKKRCYRQLILNALLSFCLGLIVRFLVGLF